MTNLLRQRALQLVPLIAALSFTVSAHADIIYLSNFLGNSIDVFPFSAPSFQLATNLNGPRGIAFDRSGNLFVSNSGSNTILEYTRGGIASVFATTGLSNPNGLAFDSAAIFMWRIRAATQSRDSPLAEWVPCLRMQD